MATQDKKTKFFILLTLVIPMIGLPLGVMQVIHGQFTWQAPVLFGIFFLISLMGISVGFHRLFAHRAFTASAPIKWFLGIAGSMTWQGNLLNWAAEHRLHHALSDHKGDFHSPFVRQDGTPIKGVLKQFAHSHFLWFFRRTNKCKYKYVRDLMRDKALRFIDDNYLLWSVTSLVLPGLLGWCLYLNDHGFWQGVLWGGLIRICLFHHTTWCINSVTHLFGKRRYQTDDHSHNLTWYAILGFGEGYHNNHHAFPRSACFGFDKGQIFDGGWYTIKFFEKLHLIKDVIGPPTLEERLKKLIGAESTEVKQALPSEDEAA